MLCVFEAFYCLYAEGCHDCMISTTFYAVCAQLSSQSHTELSLLPVMYNIMTFSL